MVLDAENKVILFQLSNAFTELLTKEVEKKAIKAIEAYSTLHAVPLPDSKQRPESGLAFCVFVSVFSTRVLAPKETTWSSRIIASLSRKGNS